MKLSEDEIVQAVAALAETGDAVSPEMITKYIGDLGLEYDEEDLADIMETLSDLVSTDVEADNAAMAAGSPLEQYLLELEKELDAADHEPTVEDTAEEVGAHALEHMGEGEEDMNAKVTTEDKDNDGDPDKVTVENEKEPPKSDSKPNDDKGDKAVVSDEKKKDKKDCEESGCDEAQKVSDESLKNIVSALSDRPW